MKHSKQRNTALTAFHVFLRLTTVGSKCLQTLLSAPSATHSALHTGGEAARDPNTARLANALLSFLGASQPSLFTRTAPHYMPNGSLGGQCFPFPMSISALPENRLDSVEPRQHSPKTTQGSGYPCVSSTRNAQAVTPCKHCCQSSCIPTSTRLARLTLLQALNLTLELRSAAVAAANIPTQGVHRCNVLPLRHSKRQMHAHLCSCHDANAVDYTAPFVPCFIYECADVKYHGCTGPPQSNAEAMLISVSGELAPCYNTIRGRHLMLR